MGDEGIFATTTEVQRKVGANASATANAETYINDFMTQAESYINCVSKRNWSDDYSGLNVDVKGILKMAASNLAAIWVIQYDMGSIGNTEAQARLNVLYDGFNKAMKQLEDKNIQTFMDGET